MKKFARDINKNLHKPDPNFGVFKKIEEIIQSLKQPKQLAIEFEMEKPSESFAAFVGSAIGEKVIKLYKEGENNYVNITSIKPI